MMLLKSYLLFILLLFISISYAQNVSGTVTDASGFPLSDVEITNKISNETTLTDFDGNFTIKANEKDPLSFYASGFEEKTILATKDPIKVSLSEGEKALSDVVAIGYGTQKKELTSSAYSIVDSEELVENNPIRIDQALQGKASGVQVNANSGSPGASYNIRIRGITTNGDNNPLVIIDGVNMGSADLSIVDPNDIENITIIKDAAAAIYGVQGANGVILITTKSGKNKKTQFSYNGSYTIQEASNLLKLMDAKEYAAYVNESYAADGGSIPYPDFLNYGKGTNWQAQLFTKAPINSQSLTASGGSDVLTYSLSGSYLNQDGIIAPNKSNFQRWTLRNNMTIALTKKLNLNTFILYTNNASKGIPEGGRGSVLYYAYNASPLTTVYDGNSPDSPSKGFAYLDQQGIEMVNPMAVLNNTYNKTDVDRFTGKIELDYEIIKDLKLTSRYNFNTATVDFRSWSPLAYYGPNKVVNSVNLQTGSNTYNLDRNNNGVRDVFSTAYQSSVRYYSYQFETFANYNFHIGKNNFTTLFGFTLQSNQGKGTYGTGYMTQYEDWDHAYLNYTTSYISDTIYQIPSLIQSPATARWEDRLASIYGRIQYDYQNKYLFTAMLRRDGSTNFGPNNRFGYFPSFSAGWNVDKEKFFHVNFMNNLKIRGSWGILGNDRIGSFAWLGLIQPYPAEATYPFGNTLYYGSAVGRLANPDLKWERGTQTDIGFDATLFKNTTTVSFDYYNKSTKDLLLSPEVSGLLGATAGGSSAPVINAGSVKNNGVDFSIGYNSNFTKNFNFNVGYNLTYVHNKVLDVANSPQYGGLFGLSTITSRMQVGAPIGAFFGYIADGVFQNQAEIDNSPTQQGAKVGDIKYRDLNGDGIIAFGKEDDIAMIGNPIPKFLMGFNFGANWKNFDFALSLYASIGNDVVRSYERFQPDNNRLAYYLDRWTGEGTSNKVPRASNSSSNNNIFSSFYVEDGSYLRIQNIQIGYDLTKLINFSTTFSKARIYLSVNNLYTFTKYLGYNPEVSNASPLGAGVDYGQYPLTRTFITGLSLNF